MNQDWADGLTEEKAAYATHVVINQVFAEFIKRKHGIDCTESQPSTSTEK